MDFIYIIHASENHACPSKSNVKSSLNVVKFKGTVNIEAPQKTIRTVRVTNKQNK